MSISSSSYTSQFNGLQKEAVQKTIFSKVITKAIADFAIEDKREYQSPYLDTLAASSSNDGNYDVETRTSTDETFTIDDQLISAERIKNISLQGSEYDLKKIATVDHQKAIAVAVDQRTLSVMKDKFTIEVTDGDMGSPTNSGGTNPIIISSSNVMETFDKAGQKLEENDSDATAERFAVTSPQMKMKILAYLRSTGNVVMDDVLRARFGIAYTGTVLGNNFDLFTSNLVPRQVVGTFSGQPSATQTITVDGVVWTYVSSLGTTPGTILIGADQDAALTNTVNALTKGSGEGTTYVDVSSSDRKKLRKGYIEAVADTTANTMTVTYYRPLTVSKTASNFAFGDVQELVLFGQKGIVFARAVSALKSGQTGSAQELDNGGVMITAKDQISGFSGVELEVSQMYDVNVWNNTTGFGGVIRIKKA